MLMRAMYIVCLCAAYAWGDRKEEEYTTHIQTDKDFREKKKNEKIERQSERDPKDIKREMGG